MHGWAVPCKRVSPLDRGSLAPHRPTRCCPQDGPRVAIHCIGVVMCHVSCVMATDVSPVDGGVFGFSPTDRAVGRSGCVGWVVCSAVSDGDRPREVPPCLLPPPPPPQGQLAAAQWATRLWAGGGGCRWIWITERLPCMWWHALRRGGGTRRALGFRSPAAALSPAPSLSVGTNHHSVAPTVCVSESSPR